MAKVMITVSAMPVESDDGIRARGFWIRGVTDLQ